jgi:hypothetical protein
MGGEIVHHPLQSDTTVSEKKRMLSLPLCVTAFGKKGSDADHAFIIDPRF